MPSTWYPPRSAMAQALSDRSGAPKPAVTWRFRAGRSAATWYW